LRWIAATSAALLGRRAEQNGTRVAARADQNADLKFETAGDKRKIMVAKLDRLGEPDSLLTLRREVHHLMPKAGIPDILLEVMSRTGFAKAFSPTRPLPHMFLKQNRGAVPAKL
jgi:hypothetical protein